MLNDEAAHTAPNMGEFQVQAATEIAALLRLLLQQQTRVTLSNAAGISLSSQLSSLDEQRGALNFEVRPADPVLRSLLASGEISAAAYLDDIRVQFELEELMLVNGATGATLHGPLPTQVYRFQRRQAYRVRPSSRSPQVRLAHPEEQTELRARILDLSVGGLALLLPPELTPWPLGQILPAVRIELDRGTQFTASLRVQHVHGPSSSVGGTPVGLAFANIEPPAVRELQLYIDQAQKRSRLLRRD
ncbi:hypothetical protein BH11PSE10_BH11PSE10_05560 [soil metagenome]